MAENLKTDYGNNNIGIRRTQQRNQELIGVLLTLGAKELKGYDETMQAISDYRNGNVTVCDSFEDYLKKVHA